MKADREVWVVVPTYNEKVNLTKLVTSLEELKLAGLRLLVVDDSSPDGTGELVRELSANRTWVSLLERPVKGGIGSAYQDGLRSALSSSSAWAIMEMDADLQHPPSTIQYLLKALADGADVAVGSRYMEGGGIVGLSLWRRSVSKGANGYARFLLRLPVRDATSGFRAYSRKAAMIIAESGLPAKGFEFQVASLQLLKSKMKIVEVPYTFSSREAGASKLGLMDMANFLFGVIRLAYKSPPD